jgi:hypothetical protein
MVVALGASKIGANFEVREPCTKSLSCTGFAHKVGFTAETKSKETTSLV